MGKLFVVVAVIAIALSLAVPARAQLDQAPRIHNITNDGPIVCPSETKTGGASFDSFLESINNCKFIPRRHFWNLWSFWRRSQKVIKTRKIPKEPTIKSALFSIRRPC